MSSVVFSSWQSFFFTSFACSGYRYGSDSYRNQGQERDDEVSGKGNSYTAEFWQYDSRLGRRWNIDPVVKHHESPYAAFANNPIYFIDPDGLDGIATIEYAEDKVSKKGKVIKGGSTIKNSHVMTIEARYLFNRVNMKEFDSDVHLSQVLKEFNNSNFVVQARNKQFYKVKFNLEMIPMDMKTSLIKEELSEVNAGDYLIYGNYVEVIDFNKNKPLNVKKLNDDGLGNATYRGIDLYRDKLKSYFENNSLADVKTTMENLIRHEVLHNLGGAHSDGGGLDPIINQTGETDMGLKLGGSLPKKLIENNVRAIVNRAQGSKEDEKERPGTVRIVNKKKK